MVYEHQEYPKALYRSGEAMIVHSEEEEAAARAKGYAGAMEAPKRKK